MGNSSFDNTIHLIHEEISIKLKNANKIIDFYIESEIPLIPKLSKYFFKNRGKQLRPVMCLLSSKMINQNYSKMKSDIHMAAAIEFVHGATLLHDDVIDQGQIRRGQKSINAIWNNKYSVLLGDFMFSKSFQLMAKSKSIQAMESMSLVSSKISEGEFLQLTNEKNIKLTDREYIQIISLKTAELFGAAMKIPAILGNHNDQTVKKLGSLGVNFGIIFQIIDDSLDYFGQKEFGKKIGKDFLEGKVTLPIILLIKKSTKEENTLISSIFNKKKRSNKDLKSIINLLTNHEIKKDIINYLKKYILNSQKILNLYKNKQSRLLSKLLEDSISRRY